MPPTTRPTSASSLPPDRRGDSRGEGGAVDEAHPPSGLSPAEARGWIALQQAMALRPEAIGERIRAGERPEAILSGPLGLGRPDSGLSRRIETLEKLAVRVVPLGHSDYPPVLAELVDAPLVLLIQGRVPALSAPSIAIVGARAATHAARGTARRLARELASAGFSIVSGLARGIDAEAHRGALEAGGMTVGVLACGLDRLYPPEHRSIAREMTAGGAVVTEMPLGAPPRRVHFPLRNRIISGLCRAVIVVEARRRSGSLITVRHALGQGREVFVVPGSIEGPFAEGSNQLLRDGARPIRTARDVLDDLGDLGDGTWGEVPVADRVAQAATRTSRASPLEDRLLEALAKGPAPRERLLVHAEFDAHALASALLELELKGRVVEERDGRIHVVWD